MVVGAESIGDRGGFDSLLLESSSSSSTSSSSAGLTCLSLPSLPPSSGGNLFNGSCPPCDALNEPRIPPHPFVRLLFSFTCGFERMQPLKSSAAASTLPRAGAGVAGGDETPFFAFELASDVSLERRRAVKGGKTGLGPGLKGRGVFYLSEEILQLGMLFNTSFEMGRLGTGLGNFFSILPFALGTTTNGGFLVGGGDMARLLTSQSLPDADTAPRYLARPALLLCTVAAGLRNSDELFATSTDIASLLFLIFPSGRQINR